MDAAMKEKKTRAPIKNEASNGVSNKKYTVAMARTNDPDSATAQFFINLIDNDFLDKNPRSAGYAVFGQVVEGVKIVDEIGKVKTGNKGFHQDVPVEPITIESVTVAAPAK
jgi:cyclophilin family peptidyl-prolyl cis-trans isomerase